MPNLVKEDAAEYLRSYQAFHEPVKDPLYSDDIKNSDRDPLEVLCAREAVDDVLKSLHIL